MALQIRKSTDAQAVIIPLYLTTSRHKLLRRPKGEGSVNASVDFITHRHHRGGSPMRGSLGTQPTREEKTGLPERNSRDTKATVDSDVSRIHRMASLVCGVYDNS